MKKSRRKFTKEFKEASVKLITEQGYQMSEAALKLHIPYHTNKTIITIEGPHFSTRTETMPNKKGRAKMTLPGALKR